MSELIRELRVKLGISQAQLARAVNANQSTISRIEHNGLNTNYRLVYKILLFLQTKKFSEGNIMRSFLNNDVLEFMVRVMQHNALRQQINQDPQAVVNRLLTAVV